MSATVDPIVNCFSMSAATTWLEALRSRRLDSLEEAREAAAAIVGAVRDGGDGAVAAMIRRFDGIEIDPSALLADPADGAIDPALETALETAIARVEAFHATGTVGEPADQAVELLRRVRPLRRVALYVPGGGAVYLSTLVMCAVPARIAGVGEIVVITTPAAAATPELNALARRLGVGAIYRGGAAGVAAAAVGTASLRPVDKIVGPGNRFVTAIKQYVNGMVGIDMTAGPSEIAVVADATADPRFVAADLLAQSEHGDDSSAVCVALDGFESRLVPVLRAMAEACGSAAARRSLSSNGAVIAAPSVDDALAFVNELAPEHVSIQTADARALAGRVDNSGAVYVGPWSAVAIGDYVAGPNHVLPTAGAARFCSPLGVEDFVKRQHVVELPEETFCSVAGAAVEIAMREGLPLHAASVSVRRKR